MTLPPRLPVPGLPTLRHAAPWFGACVLGLLALVLALVVRPQLARARAAVLQDQVAWLEDRQTAPAVVGDKDAREVLRASLPPMPSAGDGGSGLRVELAALAMPPVALAADARQAWVVRHESIEPGLTRERWRIPVTARYPALKAALAEVFNRHPHAALDRMVLEAEPGMPQRLRGELEISLYFRRAP